MTTRSGAELCQAIGVTPAWAASEDQEVLQNDRIRGRLGYTQCFDLLATNLADLFSGAAV